MLVEALANTEFTFDKLNYNLYTLNKEIFNQLNKETTAFFKFLHQTPDVDYKMKEWLAWVKFNTAFSVRNMDSFSTLSNVPEYKGVMTLCKPSF